MYLDVKQIKALQARAVAARVGSTIIEPIIEKIKSTAAKGNDEVRILCEEYNIDKHKVDYVVHWARLCGFVAVKYEDYIFIEW